MEAKYKFGHRPGRRRRTRILIVTTITLLIVGIGGALITLDLRNSGSDPVEGTSRSVAQVLDEDTNTVNVDEPTFSLQLPSDWKQVARTTNTVENSVTWRATKAREDNRMLKIYVDVIPKNYAVNRMLPLTARGTGLTVGEVSSNCATFTKPSGERKDLDEPGKWQGVEFLCELGNTIDNQIGTSSTDGVNTLFVTGPTKGKHAYFFLYTDRNIQPNNTILFNALRSFKAK